MEEPVELVPLAVLLRPLLELHVHDPALLVGEVLLSQDGRMTLPDHMNVALIARQRLACTFEVDGLLGLSVLFGPLLDHSLHRRRTGLVVKWRLSLGASCFSGRVCNCLLLTVSCGGRASVTVNVVSGGDR